MERERPPPLNKEKARPWSQVAAAVSSLQILFSVVHEGFDCSCAGAIIRSVRIDLFLYLKFNNKTFKKS